MYNEELHNLYSSPYLIGGMESVGVQLAGHVARMGDIRKFTAFYSENLKVRGNLQDLGVDGRIMLKLILTIQVMRM